MRWQLASTFALTAMSAACYGPNTVDCGDGFLCPVGSQCAEPGVCGEPARVAACFDMQKETFETCSYRDDDVGDAAGVCLQGVCSPCSADLAGCATAIWTPMTVPPATLDLSSIWIDLPPADAPVTHAYAGGLNGTLLEYDGRAWRVAIGPATTGEILSVWGSGSADIYAVTAADAFHFDGNGWRSLMDELPAGTSGLKDVNGAAPNDVYAVGLDTIVHFDGTSWTTVSMATASWSATIPRATGFLAVGGAGRILMEGAVTPIQPLPSPYTSVTLNDVFMNGEVPTLVGASASAPRTTLFELIGNVWTLVGPAGLSGVNLTSGWRNFAVGNLGNILRHTGTEWTAFPTSSTPGDNDLRAMAGANDEVFVVGRGGAIWRYSDR